MRRGAALGPEGATSQELEPEKLFLPEPDCLSTTFNGELPAKRFEHCQANPCVFRRLMRGKVVVIIVVYVDDVLVASEMKHGEDPLVASSTATLRSGVRSGAGTVFTPHRLQCGILYRCNAGLVQLHHYLTVYALVHEDTRAQPRAPKCMLFFQDFPLRSRAAAYSDEFLY